MINLLPRQESTSTLKLELRPDHWGVQTPGHYKSNFCSSALPSASVSTRLRIKAMISSFNTYDCSECALLAGPLCVATALSFGSSAVSPSDEGSPRNSASHFSSIQRCSGSIAVNI